MSSIRIEKALSLETDRRLTKVSAVRAIWVEFLGSERNGTSSPWLRFPVEVLFFGIDCKTELPHCPSIFTRPLALSQRTMHMPEAPGLLSFHVKFCGTLPFPLFPDLLENPQNFWGNGDRFLARTMAEKNGNSVVQ